VKTGFKLGFLRKLEPARIIRKRWQAVRIIQF